MLRVPMEFWFGVESKSRLGTSKSCRDTAELCATVKEPGVRMVINGDALEFLSIKAGLSSSKAAHQIMTVKVMPTEALVKSSKLKMARGSFAAPNSVSSDSMLSA
jgi:histidinol phosphatase-like PHP family hydrolase